MILPELIIENAATGMQVAFTPGGGTPDGSVFVQAKNDRAPTRIQLQPTSGQPAEAPNCAAELTLSNTSDNTNYGRLNFSSMTDGSYRIGQECGGTTVMEDLDFATESSGSSPVTKGTEVYLKVDKDRVGDSQPVAVQHGHLRFDVDNMGGDPSTPYVGRGGGGNISVNGSEGGGVTLLAGGTSVLETAGGVVNFAAPGASTPGRGMPLPSVPAGFLVVRVNGQIVRLPFYL